MLAAAERWGGVEDGRPYLPRAFSHARATPVPGGVELSFLLEEVGPGTTRLAQLQPGEGLALVGPLGIGFRPPAPGTRPLLVGGGIGAAPLLCLQDELGEEAPVAARLPLRRARAGGRSSSAARWSVATDDGSAGRHGLVTDLLRERLDADRRAHRLRVRAAGDARGGAGALRRARRARPAGARVGHGVRLRRVLRLRGAHARRLPAAVRGRAGAGRRPAGHRAGAGAGH